MGVSMGVSLDNSARNRASSPGEARPVPVSATESNAMSLKFDIQPTANPTSDKDRAAKLEARYQSQVQHKKC